jgi:hypothetical protein
MEPDLITIRIKRKSIARLAYLALGITIAILLVGLPASAQSPVDDDFTYQGRLLRSDAYVDGTTCDFRFDVYDLPDVGSGTQLGSVSQSLPVNDGYFTVHLNFGDIFSAGEPRYMEIAVRCPDDSGFTSLAGRVALRAVPYARSVPWNGITGKPPGFADDTDDGQAYTVGFGLNLDTTHDNQISVNDGLIQRRIEQNCSAGSAIRQIAQNGSVICEPDDNTLYNAGDGLTLTSNNTLEVDFSVAQHRVYPCPAGQVMRSVDQDGDAGCVPLTTVAAGDGLTTVVDGSTNVITVSVATGGITTTMLARNAVTATNLANGAVSSSKIADGSIAFSDMAQNGCGPNQVMQWNGSQSAWVCAKNQVDNLPCSNNQVARFNGSDWICDTAPRTDNDTLGALGCSEGYAPKVIGGLWKCAPAGTSYATGDGLEENPAGTLRVKTSDLAGTGLESDATNNLGIADNAITSAKIKDGEVTAADIASNAVGSDEIIDDSITAADIGNNAVGSDEISNNSITINDIGTGAVGSDEISNNSITVDDIGSNAVGSDEIVDNSIAVDDIGTGAVGSDEIINNSITADDIGPDAVGMSEIDESDTMGKGSSGATDLIKDGGDQYIWATTFTPSADGKCLVNVDATISSSGTGNDPKHPYMRTAKYTGTGGSEKDNWDDRYFSETAHDDGRNANATAVYIWPVTGGQQTKFGCYVYNYDNNWDDDETVTCHVAYICN